MVRWGLGLLLGVGLAVAAFVQLLSSSVFGGVAVSGSLPHAVRGDWGLRVLDRTGLAGVAGVRLDAARMWLARGDAARAAQLLGDFGGVQADDLRGRIAAARGDGAGALAAFARAGDYTAASGSLDALARRDPARGLRVTAEFAASVARVRAAPEVLAQIDWRMGQMAVAAADADPAQRAVYDRRALALYRDALTLAPNEETFLLAFGLEALKQGQAAASLDTYRRAVDRVPNSVDAFVGIAAAAATVGDCAQAREAAVSARGYAREQRRAIEPIAGGYPPPVPAAVAHCLS